MVDVRTIYDQRVTTEYLIENEIEELTIVSNVNKLIKPELIGKGDKTIALIPVITEDGEEMEYPANKRDMTELANKEGYFTQEWAGKTIRVEVYEETDGNKVMEANFVKKKRIKKD